MLILLILIKGLNLLIPIGYEVNIQKKKRKKSDESNNRMAT